MKAGTCQALKITKSLKNNHSAYPFYTEGSRGGGRKSGLVLENPWLDLGPSLHQVYCRHVQEAELQLHQLVVNTRGLCLC